MIRSPINGVSPDLAEDIDFDACEPTSALATLQPRAIMPPRVNGHRIHATEPTARAVPHSIEMEECFLSCCMLDEGETLAKHELSSAAFYSPANRLVYDRLREILAEGKPVELATLMHELKTRGELDQIGGYAFLVQISTDRGTTAQAGYFAGELEGFYTRRRLIHAADDAREKLFDPAAEISDVAASLSDAIKSASTKSGAGSRHHRL